MNELSALQNIDWLHAIWQPMEIENAKVVATPEEFFERVYQSPYEDWCVEDHQRAAHLYVQYEEAVKAVARAAHQAAWARYPQPEFCALLYDDVYSIGALLLIEDGKLRPFTIQRLQWYQCGRVPSGYEGEFPDGIWIVV